VVLNLTPEALAEWKQYPQTLEVFRFLREVKENFRGQLERGETLKLNSVEHTALLTSKLLGQIYGVNLTLDLQPPEPMPGGEDMTGYESQRARKRAGSEG
jgi:hypothetical protein